MMIFQIFKLILFIVAKCLGLYYLEFIFSERFEIEMCFIYTYIFIYSHEKPIVSIVFID